MSIVMDDGFIVFLMDLGSGMGLSRSVERVSLGEWHNVTVQRMGADISLYVDTQTVARSRSGGQSSQLSLGQHLWLGGVSDMMSLPAALSSNILSGYTGCVHSLTVNSLPVQLLYSAITSVSVSSCDPGHVSPLPVSSPRHSVPSFTGRSYLAFNSSDIYTK